VRCLASDPRKLSGRGWGDGVEVVADDVLDRDSLGPTLAGCGAAYYLVHSMAGGERGFGHRDRTAAGNFADATARAGLERVIYLGGLGKRTASPTRRNPRSARPCCIHQFIFRGMARNIARAAEKEAGAVAPVGSL
jgi:uncharacterized protein YbjT (DUF2867 family)